MENRKYMCIKSNYYEEPYFEEGKIYDYKYLTQWDYIKNVAISILIKNGFVIPLETWREKQIDKILENE